MSPSPRNCSAFFRRRPWAAGFWERLSARVSRGLDWYLLLAGALAALIVALLVRKLSLARTLVPPGVPHSVSEE